MRRQSIPVVTVEVPQAPKIKWSAFRFKSKNNNHETAILRSTDAWIGSAELPTGTPIHVGWSIPGGSREFYGYIQSHQRRFGVSSIVCVGASWPLKIPGSHVWKYRSADQIVKWICNYFGLEAMTFPHPYVYKQFSQQGMTYWKVLQYLAEQTGYLLHVEQTRLYFMPWEQWTARQQGRSIGFVQHNGGVTGRGDSTLVEFNTNMSDNNSATGAPKIAPVLTGTTASGAAFAAVGTGSPGTVISGTARPVTTTAVNSGLTDPALARSLAKAMGDANRFSYQAGVVLSGDPRVQAGSPLLLSGIGNLAGLWTVLDADHRFDREGGYEIRGTVGSDGLPSRNKSAPALNSTSVTDGWSGGTPIPLDAIKSGFTAPITPVLRTLKGVPLPSLLASSTPRWCAR